MAVEIDRFEQNLLQKNRFRKLIWSQLDLPTAMPHVRSWATCGNAARSGAWKELHGDFMRRLQQWFTIDLSSKSICSRFQNVWYLGLAGPIRPDLGLSGPIRSDLGLSGTVRPDLALSGAIERYLPYFGPVWPIKYTSSYKPLKCKKTPRNTDDILI